MNMKRRMFNMVNVNQNNYSMSLRLEYSSFPVSNSIKKAVEKLKKVFSDAVNKIISNESSIDELIIEIKDSCDLMENILEKFVEIYEDEYFYFTSIKSMLFYILDNNELFYLPYIKYLFLSFNDLIQSKFISSSDEYKIKQNKFDFELDKFEQKFYTEICKHSEHYNEEVLSSITNSLLDL